MVLGRPVAQVHQARQETQAALVEVKVDRVEESQETDRKVKKLVVRLRLGLHQLSLLHILHIRDQLPTQLLQSEHGLLITGSFSQLLLHFYVCL